MKHQNGKTLVAAFAVWLCLAGAAFSATGSGSAIDCGPRDAFVGYCAADFGFTGQLTVTAWIKWNIDPSTYSADGRWANIASNNSFSSTDVGQFWLQHSSDNSLFEFCVKGNSRAFVQSTTHPRKDVWYHVAGVYDSSLSSNRMKIYVNGVLENGNNTVSGKVTSLLPSFLFKVGRWSPAAGARSFDGFIDEVTIWKKALPAEEIRDMMCRKLAGNETDLCGYWRFDEGVQDTTVDLTGNGHTGYVFRENGQAESGGSLTITDLNKAWATDEWQGHLIGITNGTGAGQKRRIISNTATALTVESAWDINPDATTIYFITTNDEWVASGASLGDASVSNFSSPVSLSLASPLGDEITAGSFTGSPAGVQIYRIDSSPNITTPPSGLDQLSQSHYYGVFLIGGTLPTYTVSYNYAGHPGISDESTLRLVKRDNYADTTWADALAALDDAANTLTISGQGGAEYILGSVADNALPVCFTSFTAVSQTGGVEISWSTASESNSASWMVERSLSADNGYLTLKTLPASGNTASGSSYSFVDDQAEAGVTYYYKIAEQELNGKVTYYGPVSASAGISLGSFENQVSISPNPCTQYAVINYQLARSGMVSARIYNMLGQQVSTVFSGSRQAGAYSVRWDGKNAKGQAVPAGVYVLRLSAGEQMFTRRITLIR